MPKFKPGNKPISYIFTALFVAVVVAAGIYLLMGSHASPPPLYTGKLVGLSAYSANASEVQQLGGNTVRTEIDLNGSTFNGPNYESSTGDWINKLTAAHIVPLPDLNTYDGNTSSTYTTAAGRANWASAVATWCEQYCAGGTYYSSAAANPSSGPKANPSYAPHFLEMMNEPYGKWYRGGAINPTDYASILTATRAALDADTKVNLTGIGILGAAADAYDNSWTTSVSSAGGYNAVQGLTVHPYGPAPSPSSLLPATASLSGAMGTGGNGWDLVYYLHQTYNKDMYITEDGWCVTGATTCGDSGNLPEQQSNCPQPTVPCTTKDDNIQQAISEVATQSWIKGFWYFNLVSYGSNTYGLNITAGHPTPAWTAFQTKALQVEAAYPSEFSLGSTPAPSDTTPPTVSISTPANSATVSGTVNLSAAASDNVGVASVQFKLDGAALGSVITASPYTYSWDTTKASNGTHVLTATASDAAQNTTTSASVTVTVNNTTAPPPAPAPAYVQNLTWNNTTKALSWSAYPGATAYNIATVHNPTTTRNTTYTWPPVTGTSFTPPPLTNETVHYGILPMAKDSTGTYVAVSGATWAPEISVTWQPVADTTSPTQPTSLGALAASSSQINLTWTASTDNVGVTGYQVYRSGGTTPLATVTTTSYGDTGLNPSTSYGYYVVAVDAAGNHSTPSATVSATTKTSATTTTLQGVVTSSTTHLPISGAHVYTSRYATANGPLSTYTNSSGQYVLYGLTTAYKHSYYYAASGYRTQSYYLQFPAGLVTKNVSLSPR